MLTGRNLISDIRSKSKLLSADDVITDRAIFNELKSTASTLIKRETNQRKLWNSPNIFTPLECILMEPAPLSECSDYQSSYMTSRSVKKIPQISEGIFGLLIQSVYAPGLTTFDFVTMERFLNILKLNIKNTKKYYWLHGGRIYTSNPDLERLNIHAYFDEDFNINDYSTCRKDSSADCINPIDKPFKIPSYLEKSLKDMVHDSLNKTYFLHREDQTPDGNDTGK